MKKRKSCVDCKEQTEEGVCLLDDENRRSVSPMSSPCVGRRVSPPINLLKEKEWDP